MRLTCGRAVRSPSRVAWACASVRCGSLPEDVRVLTATHLRRTAPEGDHHVLVFTVRKAEAKPRARAAQKKLDIFDLVLTGVAQDSASGCKKPVPTRSFMAASAATGAQMSHVTTQIWTRHNLAVAQAGRSSND